MHEGLQQRLCVWFAREQRALPWRDTRDPYAIWISEAMLQQTRVETVIPYWRRFLARFPDIATLAAAPEDAVVAAWSGLGYYRRARALRAAALAIVELHGGVFPRTRAGLLALPGIGPYTAGALLSIAFDQPEPLVDGNVLRVFARLFALSEPLERPAAVRRMWELAAELVPTRAAGDVRPRNWNQALMELGATVCLPRQPACERCPLRTDCAAHAQRRVAELPVVAKRAAPIEVRLQSLLVRRGEHVLLQQRPATGRMAELWELPTRELVAAGTATRLWPADYAEPVRHARVERDVLRTLRHSITVHRLTVQLHSAELAQPARPESGFEWAGAARLEQLALTGLTRKALH
jgi:A/G-specific adenine glycosylase